MAETIQNMRENGTELVSRLPFPSYPVGSVFQTLRGAEGGIQDHGVMSWDNAETEVHRMAKPGEYGYVLAVDPDNENMHMVYFHPSEVCVHLIPEELAEECWLVSRGTGKPPDISTLPAGMRDPYVVK